MTPVDAPTGLELLRSAAELPHSQRPATIGDLFDMRFERIDEGRVEMSITTRDDMRNPLGTLHGGVCATLLDSVVGCAVHSTLPAGVSYATLEIKVNYIRAVPTDGRRLRAIGRTIHVGGRTATAHGEVFDEEGKLVAHASTTCIIHR